MADVQNTHRESHEETGGAHESEKRQYSDELENVERSEEIYNDIHGITSGDPFPEDPLIPHEEHTLTV